MKIIPLYDRIVVERQETLEEKTKGGIFIPQVAQKKPCIGKVISVGTGKKLNDGTICPLAIKENDIILFSDYSGNEINIDGQNLLVLKEEEILGIIKQ